ncbi:MAG: hypothetical protein K0U59_10885 [Gammaproteobacteria bacterium]|nr:hypothetical protein [Gammaproteobacteria bacterium]
MSIVKRAVASVVARIKAGSEQTASISRGTLAAGGVICGWLLLNVAVYGDLIMPDAGDDGLLARRSANLAPTSPGVTSFPDTPFFGVAPEKTLQQQAEIDLTNIPITQLNLVLSGVFDSTVDERASVLVAERGQPAQRYYLGEKLPSGAEVYTVATDHLVLRRNGKMEKLTYPQADGRPKLANNYGGSRRGLESVYNSNVSEDQRQSIRERLEKLREMAKSRQAELRK